MTVGSPTLRAVFLGPPGAGKGTQAQRLAKEHRVLHVSTGDMLRQEVAGGSDLGRRAKGFMDAGQLVPDEVITAMLLARIQAPDASRAWILDGFPRTLPQAHSLDRSLQAEGIELSHAVDFEVPSDVLVQRLSGRRTCARCGSIWNVHSKPPRQPGKCDACGGELTQRADDRPDAVSKRLQVYAAQTAPVLDHYRAKEILVEIDADRPPEVVYENLMEVIAKPAG